MAMFQELSAAIGDLRDDVKTLVVEIKVFNKNAPELVKEVRELRQVIEKTEPTMKKGVELLEKLDKEMEPMLNLAKELVEPSKKVNKH